jgi:hypothetical protein
MRRTGTTAASVSAVAEQGIGTCRTVRIVGGTVVAAFVTRFLAITVTIDPRTRIAGMCGARAAGACICAVAEQAVVAAAAIGFVSEVLIARAATVALRVLAVAR